MNDTNQRLMILREARLRLRWLVSAGLSAFGLAILTRDKARSMALQVLTLLEQGLK